MGLPRIACHWLLSLSVLSMLFVFAHSTLQPHTEVCLRSHNPDNSRLVAAKNNNSNNSNNSNMIHYTTGYLNPNRSLSSSSSKSHLDDTTTAVHTRQLADIGSVLSSWGGVMKGWVTQAVVNDGVLNGLRNPKSLISNTKKYMSMQYLSARVVVVSKTDWHYKSKCLIANLTFVVVVLSGLLYPLVFMAILSDMISGKTDKLLVGSFVGMLALCPPLMAFKLNKNKSYPGYGHDRLTEEPGRVALLLGATINLVYAVSSVLARWNFLSSRFGRKSIAGGTLIVVSVLLLTIYKQAHLQNSLWGFSR
eukprot:GHVQ01010683.1.p1 GENE.GHVQ01010683.1~~GHVQ01010683.1.p1  ORF type:complete len:306 (+),score=30.50 GHVQ01010683.1:153-1070(+)